MIKVLFADVTPLNDDKLFDYYFQRTSQQRQQKINAFRFRKDKNSALGASALLDIGLRELGLNEKEMIYSERKNKKPFFKNHPEIFFNISHSESFAAAAFSDREIGIDIEKIKDADLKIAKRFFHENEYEYLLNSEEKNHEFYRMWTLKESFMKITGLGLKMPLNEFCININENISVSCEKEKHNFNFYEYDGIDGYCFSLCSGIKNEKPDFINISLKG